MLDQKQPQNDDLTDERVPFVPCRLLAISEIEVDPHGDMNAEYERLYPNDPAFFPEPEYFDDPDCPYCGAYFVCASAADSGEPEFRPGVVCPACGVFIDDEDI